MPDRTAPGAQAEPRGDREDNWTTLDDLPRGALFETRSGVRAVKSEYRYPNGQWECVLLDSGEYAHYTDGNATAVREIDVEHLTRDLEAAQRYLATERRMMAKVDEALPTWEGTGRGRIDTIRELRAELEAARHAIVSEREIMLAESRSLRADLEAVQQSERDLEDEVEHLSDDNRRLTECWNTEMQTHKETHAELEAARQQIARLIEERDEALDETRTVATELRDAHARLAAAHKLLVTAIGKGEWRGIHDALAVLDVSQVSEG